MGKSLLYGLVVLKCILDIPGYIGKDKLSKQTFTLMSVLVI